MEFFANLVLLLIMVAAGWTVYQSIYMAGKKEGSRKGYQVGRRKGWHAGRRRRRPYRTWNARRKKPQDDRKANDPSIVLRVHGKEK